MCDRAPRPETQQHRIHRSPEGESHPVATVDAPSTKARRGSALPRERHSWRGGGGGTSPPRRRYLFLKPYFFLS